MFLEDGISGNLEAGWGTEQVVEAMENNAGEILDYAQANAPWEDITGMARDGLGVEIYEEGGELVLDLYHSVDYGIWLETIQNGRFATIMPTLEVFADQVFQEAGASLVGSFE